jgi:hypothetical protein
MIGSPGQPSDGSFASQADGPGTGVDAGRPSAIRWVAVVSGQRDLL